MIDYRLIRSDRRTLSISIDREGALVVRAPKRMSIREIEAFITQRQNWIDKQRIEVQNAARLIPRLEEGALVPFWGGTLKIGFSDVKKAVHQGGILWLPCGAEAAQQARKWRLQQAQTLITPRVDYWARRTGLLPAQIAYGGAATRWGSMNVRTRSLRLNAALVHCPQDVVDYVIVHELVHIIQPDHSAAFHAAVRGILPDADRKKAELKRYSGLIGLWQQSEDQPVGED